ncbi:hypothetical protein DE169_003276 [Clostridium acetobutylicum]|nr:hypothetical protein [Clostridium acetobutylicum]
MAEASEDETSKLLDEMGTIQDTLDNNDFYVIDVKIRRKWLRDLELQI